MAIDMTNVDYVVRYFLNGKQYCDDRHCFDFGWNQPIVPQVGDRVSLETVPELCFDNDEYANMPEHWYEVLGVTYNMSSPDADELVLIDVEAVDVTDEVMDECELNDECDCCCPHCGGDC